MNEVRMSPAGMPEKQKVIRFAFSAANRTLTGLSKNFSFWTVSLIVDAMFSLAVLSRVKTRRHIEKKRQKRFFRYVLYLCVFFYKGARHFGIFERIRFCRILFGFHQNPAFVFVVGEQLEYRVEIYAAVAGDGKRAVFNRG